MSKLDTLQEAITARLGERVKKLDRAFGELTLTVAAADYLEAARLLRDDPTLKFEQLVDLCGVDYSSYRDVPWEGLRFCVVSHLLSLTHNWRLRLKVFCLDDDVPQIPSLAEVWSSTDWFEREAFDLFGIIFDGHPDLRRILTDYGFIGHPFRKDFPVSGHVEMIYDAEKTAELFCTLINRVRPLFEAIPSLQMAQTTPDC
jgi:NADH-quinone oxidoreductase subunit C